MDSVTDHSRTSDYRGGLEIVDHSGVPSDHDRLLPGQAVPAQRLRCLGLHAAAGRRKRRICPEPGHLQEATFDGRGVPGVGVATARTGLPIDCAAGQVHHESAAGTVLRRTTAVFVPV
uniref:(northern house mosquito) hypothetical protein n=1 Tax=Culex pipiens TaxID=7175 RepID=A0A8D8J6W9_CULPI